MARIQPASHLISILVLASMLLLAAPALPGGEDVLETALPRTVAKCKAGDPVTVVGLGDSITTYYGNRTRHRYRKLLTGHAYYGVFASLLKRQYPGARIRVVNRGVGGEVAPRGLARLDEAVLALDPDLVFVMYGANDGRGAWPMDAYRANLSAIVRRLREKSIDVVLVAPTMSLKDIAWLLPYREGVLTLADTADATVLDGTRALWPADRDVASLEKVLWYLGRRFPPRDDIHPNPLGHLAMGQGLFAQIRQRAGRAPLDMRYCHDLTLPGPSPCRLTVRNDGRKIFEGHLQVFFPMDMPVREAPKQTLTLVNNATAYLRALPPKHVRIEPGQSVEIGWSLDLPAPEAFRAASHAIGWIGSGVGVAVFNNRRRSWHDVRWVPPGTTHLDASLDIPRRVAGTTANLGARIAWSGQAPGEVRIRTYADAKRDETAARLDPGANETKTVPLALGENRERTRIHFVGVDAQSGGERDFDMAVIEATPCVDAVDREKIVIDANLDEWEGAPWHVFPNGQAECRFTVARLSEPPRLVLAVRVRDRHPVSTARRVWFRDGIELYLDPRPEPQLGSIGPLFQLGFAPPADADAPLAIGRGTGARDTDIDAIDAAWARTPDGYAIEFALPVSLFTDETLADGRILGFGLALNNTDDPDARRVQRQWSGTNRNYATPVGHALLRWGRGELRWRLRRRGSREP